MLRVFISLPMSGRSDEEVKKDNEMVRKIVGEGHWFGDEVEFVDNLLTPTEEVELFDLLNKPVTKNLLYLGTAITKMASCNAVVFAPGWDKASDCRVEFEVAKQYDIPCFFCYFA